MHKKVKPRPQSTTLFQKAKQIQRARRSPCEAPLSIRASTFLSFLYRSTNVRQTPLVERWGKAKRGINYRYSIARLHGLHYTLTYSLKKDTKDIGFEIVSFSIPFPCLTKVHFRLDSRFDFGFLQIPHWPLTTRFAFCLSASLVSLDTVASSSTYSLH